MRNARRTRVAGLRLIGQGSCVRRRSGTRAFLAIPGEVPEHSNINGLAGITAPKRDIENKQLFGALATGESSPGNRNPAAVAAARGAEGLETVELAKPEQTQAGGPAAEARRVEVKAK